MFLRSHVDELGIRSKYSKSRTRMYETGGTEPGWRIADGCVNLRNIECEFLVNLVTKH